MEAKLVQINLKSSFHDWGSSLTSIYAFRIKTNYQEVIRGDNLGKKSASDLVKVFFFMIVHAYCLAQMCQE